MRPRTSFPSWKPCNISVKDSGIGTPSYNVNFNIVASMNASTKLLLTKIVCPTKRRIRSLTHSWSAATIHALAPKMVKTRKKVVSAVIFRLLQTTPPLPGGQDILFFHYIIGLAESQVV